MKSPEQVYEDHFGHKPSNNEFETGSFTWPDIKSIMLKYGEQVCKDCLEGRDSFEPDWMCPNCRVII